MATDSNIIQNTGAIPSAPEEKTPGVVASVEKSWHNFWHPPTPAATAAATKSQQQNLQEQKLANISSLKYATSFTPENTQDTNEYMKAYHSNSIGAQPTNELKNMALKGYIDRMHSNPQYTSLTPDLQNFVDQDTYQRLVSPLLEKQGIKPPTYEMWKAGQEYVPAPHPTATSTGTFVTTLARGAAMDTKLASNIVGRLVAGVRKSTGIAADMSKTANPVSIYLDRVAGAFSGISDDYYSNFQPLHHPWLSEGLGSIPGYAAPVMAIEASGGAALDAAGIDSTEALAAKRMPEMTKRILSLADRAGYGGKATQHMLASLINGVEVASTIKGSGGSTKEAIENGLSGFVTGVGIERGLHFGSVLKEPVSKVLSDTGSPISDLGWRIFKSGGAKQAIGGEAMVNAVSEGATQMQDGAISIKIPPSRAGRVMSLVNPDDPDFLKLMQSEIKMREHVAQEAFPEKAATAAKSGTKVWNNLSNAQRAGIISKLEELQKEPAADVIPITHPEQQLAKNTTRISQMAKENPALKEQLNRIAGPGKDGVAEAARATTKAQSDGVIKKYGLKSNPVAPLQEEFGGDDNVIKLPKELEKSTPRYRDKQLKFEDDRDRALYIVARDFTKSESDNPNSAAHGKFLSWLKQVAPEIKHPETLEGRQVRARVKALASKSIDSDTTVNIPRSEFWNKGKDADADADAEYKQSYSDRTQGKVSSIPYEDLTKDYEPIDGAFAELGAPKNISFLRMSSAATAKASRSTSTEKLISSDTDAEDFIYGTQKFLPKTGATASGRFYFENPEHHLLYIATKKSLGETEGGKKIQSKAFRLLASDFGENRTIARVRGEWQEYHMQSLKDTGHFDAEGNQFNSTRLVPAPHWTSSQGKLLNENFDPTIEALTKVAKKTGSKAVVNTIAVVKDMKKVERSAATGKEAQRIRKMNSKITSAIGDF